LTIRSERIAPRIDGEFDQDFNQSITIEHSISGEMLEESLSKTRETHYKTKSERANISFVKVV
jgi:hypothetical protein